MRTVLRRVRRHPWVWSIGAVVVVAGSALGVYFGTRTTSANAATATTQTQTVSTGTVRQEVSATGTLAPAVQDQLNFQVSGVVTHVKVTAGQHVAKGQVLATIDSASLVAGKAQARASVASAQAKVDSDTSSAASSTQLSADRAALRAARNQLASARTQLAEASLTAPHAGVVASVDLTVGQSVSGGSSSPSSDSSGTSTPQIFVISTRSWIVNATVDATSVGLIKKDNEAQLTVTGASDTVYGTVASIGLVSSASSTTGAASYPVVIDVTGSPSGMHDGADVTASIIYRQASGIVVPTLALHRNASGGEYVEQVKDGKTVQTPVHVGLTGSGEAQITSGLSSGDRILVQIPQIATQNNNGSTRLGGGNFPVGGFGGVGFPGGGGFKPVTVNGGGGG